MARDQEGEQVSALAVVGRIGLTAIADELEGARALYYEVKRTLDQAAEVVHPEATEAERELTAG